MLSGRGPDGRADRTRGTSGTPRVVGTRTAWTTVGDGGFFCPGCGGDRGFLRRTGRRWFAVLGLPLVPRGTVGPVVECVACHRRFGTDVLDQPTTRRFSVLLRDAVHAVTLAVLAADPACGRAALEAAAGVLRAAGSEQCTADQLATLVEALAADTGRVPCGTGPTGVAPELHEALDPLTPHLAPAGRASILVRGARIALADGPYTPAEREVLGTAGDALALTADEVTRLLAAARTTSS